MNTHNVNALTERRPASVITDLLSNRDLDTLPLLLEVPRAAKLLGISRSAAYRLAASEELPVRRLGGRVYVVTAKLFELVAA
ncbi:MAG TPA: helix-turn-helix domain-containing protein [Candidatus Limnocylindrales bacterium]|nr:helix-turn-helix domain-containing protein [Candidatus Limnocylindrales bacterium]